MFWALWLYLSGAILAARISLDVYHSDTERSVFTVLWPIIVPMSFSILLFCAMLIWMVKDDGEPEND